MTEQILGGAVLVLLGIIVGGAGGASLVRRTLKLPQPDEELKSQTNLAATVAATTAATFRVELHQQITRLEIAVNENTKSMAVLTGVCGERHKAIDKTLFELQKEYNNIQRG